jgi:lipoprotein-releasing system ATP-binding protein
MISCKAIEKSFGDLKVLKGVDLEVGPGEVVSIMGASGAGKTTFLQILGTLEQADAGNIKYEEQNLAELKPKALAQFRNKHIGFVFQFHHLLPEFTAAENVAIPGFIQKQPKKQALQRAHALLDFMGLQARFEHKPSALSGGEQQRVAVARALMNQPKVVLADEPTGNLDSKNAREMHALFEQIRQEFNTTFVIITHNKELAATADRMLLMKDGVMLREEN